MFNLDASYIKLLCLQKGGGGGKLSKIFLEEWSLTILVRQNNNFIKTKLLCFLVAFPASLVFRGRTTGLHVCEDQFVLK